MRTDETWTGEWWEIQHRYPGHEHEFYRRRWANTNLTTFGDAAIALVREVTLANVYNRSEYAFTSSEAATDFLAKFVRVAIIHTTTEFRVAHIRAAVTVEGEVMMAPPPICGKYGYYGRVDSRRHEDLYCQQPPGHGGKHGLEAAS